MAQYSFNDKRILAKHVKPPITIPNDLPKPDFMPSKLVRISDMKVVDGSQVNEGYCSLSYSWNQSGSIIYNPFRRKYARFDKGKHKIIRLDGNYEYVKFEGIIQHICQQFNIKYIWCDQLCINQHDKEEKHHEIRNMHQIYENAYCTVAFVPDFTHDDYLHPRKQQYFKRLWTLEEIIKSKKLLFVGRNEHQYGDSTLFELNLLTKSPSGLNASQILYHAHQRTSTKEHDRVFALIQLYPEFIDKVKIDYDQPFEN
ncbi:heterokaryon incompatibility protein-domain-containing protein [Phascolomyces articulosus]|uniref:Heterokaryon incompatibility protein-domain-containing protein n=1 Tax=Phascolomyces articulosus TaxID=60185 RepID=A0AAD5PC00_9FUNG|nr:heterokaryon incompatibility protein-domain-containing protein [Phascolomyces articulosus]